MRKSIKPLVILLCLAGCLPLFYKIVVLGLPLFPERQPPSYRVEARVSFSGLDTYLQIALQIPKRHPGFQITNENFISDGFSIRTKTRDDNRIVKWSRKQASGAYDLFYEVTLKALPDTRTESVDPPSELIFPDLAADVAAAAQQVLEEARKEKPLFESYIPELNSMLRDSKKKAVRLLLGTASASPAARERALRKLLAVGGIPYQRVRGFDLTKAKRNAPLMSWLEIWNGSTWREFDVERNIWGVPETYFAWWRGDMPVMEAEGADRAATTFSIATIDEDSSAAMIARSAEKGWVLLYTLPAEVQTVYRLILLIPLGGLIMVALRNVIGFNTFGTFMPVLIALAFRETRLVWGLLLFILVVGAGLLVRFYFERLRLLLVPRLASTLTIVIMLLLVVSGFANYFALDRGPSVALFPMVIMTMTIERMSVQWEETGPLTALRKGLATLCAAALVYVVLTNQYIEYAFFTFPELLFLVLAISVMLGRYTGYRLFELWRFRSFMGV